MGDLKVLENFVDRVYVTDTGGGHPATGLTLTCTIIDESGNRSVGTFAEMGNGWYKVTDFTPDAIGTWCTEWAAPAGYTVHYPYKEFKVGGGVLADIDAKTTNLPADPADDSDIDTSVAALNTLLTNGTYGLSAINTALTFQQQADAAISQANPISDQLYTVLNTTLNARIISLATYITWATTQPTNLRIVITIDGNTITYTATTPVSATVYYDSLIPTAAAASQSLSTTAFSPYRAFLLEGRSIKVEVAVTWATTQPTPLVCRVKYAKR